MARKKDNLLNQLLAGLSVQGILLHPATLLVLASVGTIVGAIHLWSEYQTQIIDHQQYQLTEDKIHVTDPPAWSDTDLKRLVLDDQTNGESPSLLDTQLVKKTVKAFQSVSWVEQVRSVEKSKDGLDIDVVYREAVGMVELNYLTVSDWPRNRAAQILPVDRQGVIMPGDLIPKHPLLRFSIFNPSRTAKLDSWTRWPDDRIQSAAAIASALENRWQSFGLYRIVTFRKPPASNAGSDQSVPFELWPDVGTQVVWGNPPGEELAGEASVIQKLAAMEAFVASYGPLNLLPKQKIDIRSGRAMLIGNSKTAELESLIKNR